MSKQDQQENLYWPEVDLSYLCLILYCAAEYSALTK